MDLELSRNFRLSEWPCHQLFTEEQIQGALEAATVHLQPLRDRFGAIRVTSGPRWRVGCVPRSGPHKLAGTVDYVPLEASVDEVFDYAQRNMRDTFGTLIHERDHLHRTAPGAQGRFGVAMLEPSEGVYHVVELAKQFVSSPAFGALLTGGLLWIIWRDA